MQIITCKRSSYTIGMLLWRGIADSTSPWKCEHYGCLQSELYLKLHTLHSVFLDSATGAFSMRSFRNRTLASGRPDSTTLKKRHFPDDPVVRTLCFHCRGTGSIPSWETKIPHELAWSKISKQLKSKTKTKNNNHHHKKKKEVATNK